VTGSRQPVGTVLDALNGFAQTVQII